MSEDGSDLMSNTSEIQNERGRTLFDFTRQTSESAQAYRADLSRMLRDGVSLYPVLQVLSSRANLAPKWV